MEHPAVELVQVTHSYGRRIALNAINLVIEPGCVCAFLGPNGGGKTTLFRAVSTLIVPTSGTVRIFGDDALARRQTVRSTIGVVFQNPSLDVHLTVFENMMHQGHLYGLHGKNLENKINTLLDRFDICDRAGDRVKNLSGGLARRVEVAKALLHRPKLLVLDEPGSGLDPAARVSLLNLLKELRDHDGVTCLLTTHLEDEADQCDRAIILDAGRVVADGPPLALKQSIGGDIVSIHCEDPELLSRQILTKFGVEAKVVDGRLSMELARGHHFVPQLIEAFPGQIISLSVGRPTLADVFERVTGHGIQQDLPRLSLTQH